LKPEVCKALCVGIIAKKVVATEISPRIIDVKTAQRGNSLGRLNQNKMEDIIIKMAGK
jgi:hypothetical protein